jgi:hypothetical protein
MVLGLVAARGGTAAPASFGFVAGRPSLSPTAASARGDCAADCQTSNWVLFGPIARVGLSCCALIKSKSAAAVGCRMDDIREGESHL